jgi:hypothetical protein
MALERWRKTEKMTASLDAYNSEFPREQSQWETYTDHTSPSPGEMQMADEFAREMWELNEKYREISDRIRTIREWQYRYASKYQMAHLPIYTGPPKEEEKPKVVKAPKMQPGTLSNQMFGTFKGEAYIGEHKVGLGEVTLNHAELTSKPYNIEKKTNYVDATAFGDTTKTYLVEGAALPKLTLNNDQIGYVKEFQDTPEGVIVTATITDPKFWDYIQKKINPVFEHPKGNGKITAYKGKSVDSLTVDDVKKAAELVKEAGATTNWKWNDESANLYVDQLKKAIQDEVLWTGPKWKMPFTGIKKGITE